MRDNLRARFDGELAINFSAYLVIGINRSGVLRYNGGELIFETIPP